VRDFTRAAPLFLIGIVGAVAAAVGHYAKPSGGLQLPLPKTRESPFLLRIGPQQYPREAVDNDNVQIHVRARTVRVVSQDLTIDDFVYSVLPPEDVVAVSANAYQPAYSNVYRYVERFQPAIASDPERVLRLNPDLILVSSDGRADYTSLLRSSAIPLYRMQTTFRTLTEVKDAIVLIGYLTGEDLRATVEAGRFERVIENARALRPANAPAQRILGLAGGTYSYGSGTLFNDIVTQLGCVNVTAEGGLQGFVAVSSEQIVKWNPQWIITGAPYDGTKQLRAKLLADPAVSVTSAAHEGRILVLDNRIFLPISPFSTRLVEAIAQAVYSPSGSSQPL
jgi:ABC-type Fe3+-hydroxamate transport system substrate-binding protein